MNDVPAAFQQLDEIPPVLAEGMRRKNGHEPLTESEREAFHHGFRAGATVVVQLMQNAADLPEDRQETVCKNLNAQVQAWGLPILIFNGFQQPNGKDEGETHDA